MRNVKAGGRRSSELSSVLSLTLTDSTFFTCDKCWLKRIRSQRKLKQQVSLSSESCLEVTAAVADV